MHYSPRQASKKPEVSDVAVKPRIVHVSKKAWARIKKHAKRFMKGLHW